MYLNTSTLLQPISFLVGMCSVKRQTYLLTETEDSYESSIGEGGVPLRKLVPNSEKWR